MRTPDSEGRGEIRATDRSLLPGLGHLAVYGRDVLGSWVGIDPGLLFPKEAPLACYADADMPLIPGDVVLTPEQTEELRRQLAA